MTTPPTDLTKTVRLVAHPVPEAIRQLRLERAGLPDIPTPDVPKRQPLTRGRDWARVDEVHTLANGYAQRESETLAKVIDDITNERFASVNTSLMEMQQAFDEKLRVAMTASANAFEAMAIEMDQFNTRMERYTWRGRLRRFGLFVAAPFIRLCKPLMAVSEPFDAFDDVDELELPPPAEYAAPDPEQLPLSLHYNNDARDAYERLAERVRMGDAEAAAALPEAMRAHLDASSQEGDGGLPGDEAYNRRLDRPSAPNPLRVMGTDE